MQINRDIYIQNKFVFIQNEFIFIFGIFLYMTIHKHKWSFPGGTNGKDMPSFAW